MPNAGEDEVPIIIDPRNVPSAQGVSSPDKTIGHAKDAKEQYASNIALIITWTFAVSACLILIGIYLVLRRAPADAKILLDAAAPMLKEAGSFLSGVFGPLLAFVLGYYFGEKKTKAS